MVVATLADRNRRKGQEGTTSASVKAWSRVNWRKAHVRELLLSRRLVHLVSLPYPAG